MTVTIKPVSFNVSAKSIVSAYAAMDKVAGKTRDAIQIAMQQFCDAWFIENGKTVESCDAMGKTMRDSDAIVNLKEREGKYSPNYKTLNNYISGAKRALYFGVAWSAALFTNPDYRISGGKASTAADKKAGTVSTTTIDAAHKTLCKAISQYRMMNQSMLVAAMLDAVHEFYPDFVESNDTAPI